LDADILSISQAPVVKQARDELEGPHDHDNQMGHYTDELKATAVRLVRDSARPVAQVARDLGIADPLFSHWWAAQHQADSQGHTRESMCTEQKELVRLRRPIKCGGSYDVQLDAGRLALSGRPARSLFAGSAWLGDGGMLSSELTQQALQVALHRRQAKPGLLLHSDRGSPYVTTSTSNSDRLPASRDVGHVEGIAGTTPVSKASLAP
jgi:transposase-like protein